jgi:pilus assembly protein CpaE
MMGTEEFSRFQDKDKPVQACADMLIAASPQDIAPITPDGNATEFPGLMTFPCSAADNVPGEMLARAQVLVLEVDPASSRSLDRLRQIVMAWPDLPVIAAIGKVSIALTRTLVREGVSDVVSLPLQLDELLDVAASAVLAARERKWEHVSLAPQIAVVGSLGGCGATSFATHLAGVLGSGASAEHPVALVDFDLQSGMIADYVGAAGSNSLFDLLMAGDRLDVDLLRSAARGVEGNLEVFASPSEIQPIEAIDTDRALELLTLIRRNHAAVVVDLPSDWTSWSLSVVSASSLIVMVVELSVNSLRQAKRQLDLFAGVGIDTDKIAIVVNRVERRMFRSIDLSDVTATLKHELLGTLSLESELASAQTQGKLLDQVVRKSRYCTDVRAIADTLTERLGIGGN